MKYVVAISIGPVQDFIKAARKTRDLWYGSELLSMLAGSAARSVEADGAELIFPASTQEGAAAPNKIVAITPDGADPKAIFVRARAAALAHLEGAASSALNRARAKAGGGAVRALAFRSQVHSFLEMYGAWSPFEEGGYAAARQSADRLLAGRKALRNFEQPEYATGLPKSSLDGGRETVLAEMNEQARSRLQIKRGEQLDGVSLVKRLAQTQRFVSVSRVAADPWIRRAKSAGSLEGLCRIAEQYAQGDDPPVTQLKSGEFPQYADFPYDTQLFYDEPGSGDCPEAATEFRAEMKRIKSRAEAKKLRLRDPTPYLAVLAADGDRMGRLISELSSPREHRRLSDALAGFAVRAKQVVPEHNGALVYAGGDDVLAFLPLDTAISCADALGTAFADGLKDVDLRGSLSVGIAIVHFQSQLDQMLEWARQAEHEAKKNRNSLAVSLRTRSAGAECVTVVDSWSDGPLSKWSDIVGALAAGALPDGLAYKLRNLAKEFELADAADAGVFLKAEIAQAVKHSRRGGGAEAIESKLQRNVVASASGGGVEGLRNAVDRMIIGRHLVRVGSEGVLP